MSEILTLGTVADTSSGGSTGSSRYGQDLNTGVLRRKYNFSDRVSELSIAQDPFFRFLSMCSKKPTDDPSFKFTEKRGSYHKRYVYIENHGSSFATALGTAITITADSTVNFKCYTDWNSSGNKNNIKGQTATNYAGQSGTQPEFLLPGQLLKVNVSSSSGATTSTDYAVVKITDVADLSGTGNYAHVTGTVVKGVSGTQYLLALPTDLDSSAAATTSEETLAPHRSYVVGSVFDKGTGYPETWDDQPFSTGYGQTQIFKTTMAMDNTDRATVLRYEGDEWARIWKEKLIEHKWDIEQSLLFGSQSSTYRTTQGAVDWISSYGNAFSLDTATKTQDDFLDDLSNYLDPRYNNGMATVFFCNTAVFNWMHKLGGYFNNNLSIGSNFRADFAVMGKKKVLGLDATTISTVYGDMNVVRNIHLDGTNVKLLGVNMKHCAYRPLVGNGINRDTSIYVGVQTLENSGVDRRVDQILTEAGMEWSMPECHALWT
jgi:hypothetical protein